MVCSRCGFENNPSLPVRPILNICEENNFRLCSGCLDFSVLSFERIKDFSKNELGEWQYIDGKLLLFLQEIRTEIKKPFFIHCTYQKCGHAKNSFHYHGQAVDLHIGENPKEILLETWKKLDSFWLGGIGVYPHWNNPGFHLDVGTKRRWWQNRLGNYEYQAPKALEREL